MLRNSPQDHTWVTHISTDSIVGLLPSGVTVFSVLASPESINGSKENDMYEAMLSWTSSILPGCDGGLLVSNKRHD